MVYHTVKESDIYFLSPAEYVKIPHLLTKEIKFYNKCYYGPMTLSIGNCVLISNADSADPESIENCEIGRILYLYELLEENSIKDPCRAIVQWYSRPKNIPHKFYDNDDISIDFETEIIEEYRPYDNDISIETIFRKCTIIMGNKNDIPKNLLRKESIKMTLPAYVCRYKFIKTKNIFKLISLNENDTEISNKKDKTPKSNIKTPKRIDKNAINILNNSLEFIDVTNLDDIASPLKTLNIQNTPNNRLTNDSSSKKIQAARRNLNISLNDDRANSTAGSDVLNYSIINDNSPDKNDMKIKLRLSADQSKNRRRSSRISVDTELKENIQRKRISNLEDQTTPKKKPKEINLIYENTPRRKSILKTPGENTTRTPRRSILLSNIIEERIIQENTTVSTPTRSIKNKLTEKKNEEFTNIYDNGFIDDDDKIQNYPSTPKNKPNNNVTIRKKLSIDQKIEEGKNLRRTPRRSSVLSNIPEQRTISLNSTVSTPNRGSKKKLTDKEIEEFVNLIDDENDKMQNYPTTPKSKSKTDLSKTKSVVKHDINKAYEPKTPHRKSGSRKSEVEIEDTPKTKLSRNKISMGNEQNTPTHKLKLIRSGLITPTLKSRDGSSPKSAQTNLQIARANLHVSAIPDSLPCRGEEFENIFSFLHNKIQDECGGCMYISGVPGTGKTATTTGVIRYLKEMVKNDELSEFDFIEINGMKLTEPRQAYVQIYKQLTGKTMSWEQAHSLLENRFSTTAPRRTTTVILVDELDILCNRRQDVVYNLLDWPSKPVAKLVVITIANTMDLPERLLMGKVTSRLGLTRLTFQPYTHKQLQEIVTTRLSGSDAFNTDAVQLIARKVAAVSGDARRALDICRRATEIANDGQKDIVNMIHVQQALEEMIASAKVQAIKNCSRLEQIFLQAVASEVARTGVEETVFEGVYTQLEAISAFMGFPLLSPGSALKICAKLSSIRLLICEHSRTDIFQKILLNISSDDIYYALDVKIE